MNNKSIFENPNLVEAINNQVTNYTPDNVAAFERELRSAVFLAPVIFKKKLTSSTPTLIKDGDLQFITLTNTEGEVFLPAFTDWDELRKWNKDHTQILSLSAGNYADIIKNISAKGVSINPYTHDLSLLPVHLDILHKIIELKVDGNMIELNVPKDPPLKLLSDIERFFPILESIENVYFFETTRKNKTSFVFVVDSSEFERDKKMIKAYCKPYNESIQILQVSETKLLNISKMHNPLYLKKRHHLLNN